MRELFSFYRACCTSSEKFSFILRLVKLAVIVNPFLPEDLLKEAIELVEEAAKRNLVLRVFGGVAVQYHCPSFQKPSLNREIADIDLFGLSKQSPQLEKTFIDLGYIPAAKFNLYHGAKRLLFYEPKTNGRRDIFLDFFEMCHRLDLRKRLTASNFSIPLSELLMTKLQVVEINVRDYKDIISILVDHQVSDKESQEEIDCKHISKLCSADWGLYKTSTRNLGWTRSYLEKTDLEMDLKNLANGRIEMLIGAIEMEPKSARWKLRASIGERVSWYDEPEVPKVIRLGE